LPRGVPIHTISKSRGNLDEIKELGDVNSFLQWLHAIYGPLAAFHWGARYTICVSCLKLVHSLKKYSVSLLPLNPLLYASILCGDPNAWRKSDIFNENEGIADKQAELFVNYDPNLIVNNDELTDFPRKWSRGPLGIVFECEVEIDAHPIPSNIPILISVPLLLDGQSQFDSIHNEFKWIFDKCF